MEKQRTILSILLVVLGLGLLAYGLRSQAADVSSAEQGQDQAQTASELALTQEVAQSDAVQNESGQVQKTSEEGKKAPAACPT